MDYKILNFAKEQYDFGISERTRLNDVSIYITIIGILLAGSSYPYADLISVLLNINTNYSSTCIFILFYSLAVLITMLSICFLMKHQIGITYSFVLTADDVSKYYDKQVVDLLQQDFAKDEAEKLALYYVDELLLKQYMKCATDNNRCNMLKEKYLRRIKICIILATFFLIFSYPIYYLIK
jgi:hypothetical protein